MKEIATTFPLELWGAIVVGFLGWCGKSILRRLASFDNKLSLRIARHELAQMKIFIRKKSSLHTFLCQQMLICMAIVGVGLLFLPLALTGWTKAVLPIWFACAAAIYATAIYGLKTAFSVRHPQKAMKRLRKQLAKVEERAARVKI